MSLHFALTDLAGVQKAVLQEWENGEITIPHNDARTARVTLSIYDPAAAEALPLKRMLKAWYTDPEGTRSLVFWGPITVPRWTPGANPPVVEINAHDMLLRLKHHYLHFGDTAIFPTMDDEVGAIPISTTGMRRLFDAGRNVGWQTAAGIPNLNIAEGDDTHPGAFPFTFLTQDFEAADTVMHVESTLGFPTDGNLELGDPATMAVTYGARAADQFTSTSDPGSTFPEGTQITGDVPRRLGAKRGDEVYSKIRELAEDIFGPDFELEPIEMGGNYAQLNCWDKLEAEPGGARHLADAVHFHYGTGIENLENFEYNPDGEAVRNFAFVIQNNADDADNPGKAYSAMNLASRIEFGTYVYWEAGGVQETAGDASTLHAKAEAQMLAYAWPPPDMALFPKSDGEDEDITETQDKFFYLRDYKQGVVVSVAAKKGYMNVEADAFIQQVTLSQAGPNAVTQPRLDVIPYLGVPSEVDGSAD